MHSCKSRITLAAVFGDIRLNDKPSATYLSNSLSRKENFCSKYVNAQNVAKKRLKVVKCKIRVSLPNKLRLGRVVPSEQCREGLLIKDMHLGWNFSELFIRQ